MASMYQEGSKKLGLPMVELLSAHIIGSNNYRRRLKPAATGANCNHTSISKIITFANSIFNALATPAATRNKDKSP
jgi:hypothetical protein